MKLLKLICALIMLKQASAFADFHSSCTKGYEFGQNAQESFSLYMVNPKCYQACQNECSVFSYTPTTTSASGISISTGEANQDVIDRCQSFCQSYRLFSAYYTSSAGVLLATVNQQSDCSPTTVNQRVYRLSTVFKANQGLSLTLNSGAGSSNKVYSCGKDTIKIKPIIRSYAANDWKNSSVSQTYWPSTGGTPSTKPWPQDHNSASDHYCIASSSNYSTVTTNSLWSTNNADPQLSYSITSLSTYLPKQPLLYVDGSISNGLTQAYRNTNDVQAWYGKNNGPCKFSARNPNYTDTGLYVQDGDELTISWQGDYTLASAVNAQISPIVGSYSYALNTYTDQSCKNGPSGRYNICHNTCEGLPACGWYNNAWSCSLTGSGILGGCSQKCNRQPGYNWSGACNQVTTTAIPNGDYGPYLFRMTVPQLMACERNFAINNTLMINVLDQTTQGDALGGTVLINSISSSTDKTNTAIAGCHMMRMLASTLDVGININQTNSTQANNYIYLSGEYARQAPICLPPTLSLATTPDSSTTGWLQGINWSNDTVDVLYGGGALLRQLRSMGAFARSYDNNQGQSSISTIGLRGIVTDNNQNLCNAYGKYSISPDKTIDGCLDSSGNPVDPKSSNSLCYYLTPAAYPVYQFPSYSYSGTINSFTNGSRQNLGIRVLDRSYSNPTGPINAADYYDNTGGMDITITWGGCPNASGNNIEYYVAPCKLPTWILEVPTVMPTSSTIKLPTGLTVSNRVDYLPSISNSYIPSTTDVSDSAITQVTNNPTYQVTWLPVTSDSTGKLATINVVPSDSGQLCKNIGLPISNNLYVYFRIGWPKGLSSQPNINNLINLYHNPGNFYGSYALTATQLSTQASGPITTFSVGAAVDGGSTTQDNGILQDLVNFMRNTMVGTKLKNYTDGAFHTIYQRIIHNNTYVSLVNKMLLLYVAFTGLFYLMGLVQLNSHDAIIRLTKIGFVGMMTNESSWWFFSTILLPLVMNGVDDLCISVAAPVMSNHGTSIGINQVMEVVTRPLQIIWGSGIVWQKLAALIFSGFSGVFLFFICLLALVIYTMGMLKVVLIYLFAILSLAFLCFLAPIIIPMILFEHTKQYFDSWWKMFLSFMMQPVLMFACTAVLSYMIMNAMLATLGYTVCNFCYVSMEAFGMKTCLLTVPRNMQSMHAPSTVHGLLVEDLMQSAFVLLLLAYCMVEIPAAVANLASTLIMGGGPNASGAAGAVAKHLGVDSVSSTLRTLRNNAPDKLVGKAVDFGVKVRDTAVGGYLTGKSAINYIRGGTKGAANQPNQPAAAPTQPAATGNRTNPDDGTST